MDLLHKYKWLAAIAGVLLTGLPLLWLTSWLQKQGETENLLVAQWSVGAAELAVEEAAASLNDLAKRGVNSCEPPHIVVLQHAVFATASIKELGLVGPLGQTLCTDAGSAFAARDVLASMATSDPDIMLDAVRLEEGDERLLRVRRIAPRGAVALAALLPAQVMLPRVTALGQPFVGFARITLADGTLVGTVGIDSPELMLHDSNAVSRRQSARFGLIVTAAMQRDGVIANYDDLRRIATVVAGWMALIILALALVIPWRQRLGPDLSIEKALVAGEFIPYYQPIVDITSGKLLGAEVLVRWRKPDGSIISPGVFIPLVESSGFILELTRSLMRQVCAEAGSTLQARPDMYVTFNIAPRHFKDSVILNDVGAIFENSPIRLSQVVLEVTERYELENLGAARRVIAALQALGCRIALDDVGTGHSGLSYILKLGVDIIKIDKLFVEAIKTDPHTQAVVGTLVDLARNLRMKIVAEGVEHFEQVVCLREHGIGAAQGYCFAPPLPGSAFIQLVQAIDARPGAAFDKAADGAPAGYLNAVKRVAAA